MATPRASVMASPLGLGLFKVPAEHTQGLVETALDVGYRHFDGASSYGNESELGAALAGSGLDRSSYSVTSKAWIDELGTGNVRAALQRSLERLRLDWLDLYMIHWPAPERDLYVESFEELLVLRDEGLVKNVAVSNFHIDYLERLKREVGELPVLNQVERHPYLQQAELLAYHLEQGIASQAWGPLARAEIMTDPGLAALAEEAGVSVSQVVLAWHLQQSVSVIPKASSRERLEENFRALEISLSDAVMTQMASFERNYRTGPDPRDKN